MGLFDEVSTSGKDILFSAVGNAVDTKFGAGTFDRITGNAPVGDAAKATAASTKPAIQTGDVTNSTTSKRQHAAQQAKMLYMVAGAALLVALVLYANKRG